MQDRSENRPMSTSDFVATADREHTEPDRTDRDNTGSPIEEDVARGSGADGATGAMRDDNAPLFARDQAEEYRSRWTTMQAGFVDEPRQAVQQADQLVAEVMQRLAQVFSDERSRLEEQWSRGGDVSTEDLRVALQRYRSFFDRLLSV